MEPEEEAPLPEPAHPETSDNREQRPSVTVTVHAVVHDEPPTHEPSPHEESGEGSKSAQHEEMIVSAVAPLPPEAEKEASKPAPVILEIPLNAPKHEQPAGHGPVTLIVQVLADPKAMQAEIEPQPDVIVPARRPARLASPARSADQSWRPSTRFKFPRRGSQSRLPVQPAAPSRRRVASRLARVGLFRGRPRRCCWSGRTSTSKVDRTCTSGSRRRTTQPAGPHCREAS